MEFGRARVIGPFAPFTQKRRGFVHETEVRAMFQDQYKLLDDPSEHDHGSPVDVNLDRLVEDIYVAPGTAAWLRVTVQKHFKQVRIRPGRPPIRVR